MSSSAFFAVVDVVVVVVVDDDDDGGGDDDKDDDGDDDEDEDEDEDDDDDAADADARIWTHFCKQQRSMQIFGGPGRWTSTRIINWAKLYDVVNSLCVKARIDFSRKLYTQVVPLLDPVVDGKTLWFPSTKSIGAIERCSCCSTGAPRVATQPGAAVTKTLVVDASFMGF